MSKRSMLPIAVLVVLIGFLARSWLLSFVPTVNAMERFSPPDEKQRRGAIGPTTGLPKTLQRAFDPADQFEPIPAPGPSDWLANHAEPGQTFEQYRRERVNRPDKIRRKLYLQPLGEFSAATSPNLDQLKQFAEAFFTLPVELRPAVDLTGLPITRDASELATYSQNVGPTLAGHPVTVLAAYGRQEVLEGPEVEGVVILEFPSFDEAKAWYDSPAYREVREHRFRGADYRAVIVEGA